MEFSESSGELIINIIIMMTSHLLIPVLHKYIVYFLYPFFCFLLGRLRWTYKLMEGKCTNSHALETAHTYGIPSSIIERAQTLGRVFDKICRPDVLAAAGAGAGVSAGSSSSKVAELTTCTEGEAVDSNSWNLIDPSSDVSYDPLPLSRGAALRYHMDDVSEIFKGHLGGQVLELRATVVEPEQQPPPAYEGSSCVYLLIVRREGQPDTIYIGETESISQRLQQHR